MEKEDAVGVGDQVSSGPSDGATAPAAGGDGYGDGGVRKLAGEDHRIDMAAAESCRRRRPVTSPAKISARRE